MFDDATLGPQVLANPAIVQNLVITEAQNRLGGSYSIADPNNAFNLQLEASSSVFAQFVRGTENKFEDLYPARSTTAKSLYAFMSDYDYLNLTASPASIQFRLVLDADWVIASAIPFDTNYNKIVIPATTVINLSNRTFGLYYPIQLLVNNTTGVITVTYDLSVQNPLMSVSSNLLEDVTTFTQGGLNFIALTFTAYQFTTSVKTETLVSQTGFNKVYSYTDSFYAARVYTSFDNVTWVELQYSLSKSVYDVTTPTVLMTLLEDNQSIQLQIPQIYFTNNQIGRRLQAVFYTTKGALNVAIPQADANEITANFDVGSTPYAAMLSQPPTCLIVPYNQTTIVGGANALSFAQLRTAIVNQTLYNQTPITPLQIQAAASKYGFVLTKYLDNITQRIYFASNTLTTPDGRVVPVAVSGVIFNNAFLSGDPSTILPYNNNTYTILPTTVFQYNTATNISQPLTDDQVHWLSSLSAADLAQELNTNLYTRQPFHIVLDTSAKYPQARTYNLMTPQMTSLTFIAENVHSAAQLSITSAIVTHNDSGTGGFTITLGVKRSAALVGVDPSSFTLLLLTKLNGTLAVELAASYQQTTSTVDVYTIYLPTTYQISSDGYFVTQVTSLGVTQLGEIPLIATFDVRLGVAQSLYPNIAQDTALIQGVDGSTTDAYLIVSQQIMVITFGQDMTATIYNIVTTTFGQTPYATYPETVYHTYQKDVYLTNPDNTFVNRVVVGSNGAPSTVQLIQLFSKGQPVLTEQDFTLTTLVDAPTSSSTLTVVSTTGLLIGSQISGLGISPGTVISQIDETTITLSTALGVDQPSGSVVTIANSRITTTTTAVQNNDQTQLTLATTTGVVVGMTVFGFDIPSNTTVTAVSASGITLSTASTAIIQTGAVIAILNLAGPQSVQYLAGTNKLDANNNPIPLANRTNIYNVTMAQFDARLYQSEAVNDVAYVASLPQTLVNTANALAPIQNELLELTDVYYVPNRTIGQARFGIGNSAVEQLNLGISFTINLYVQDAVLANESLVDIMHSTTLALVGSAMRNPAISSGQIAQTLSNAFGTNVDSVDVSGIDNITNLDTVAVQDTGVQPSIAYILTIMPDGTLALQPNVVVNFVLSPVTLSA